MQTSSSIRRQHGLLQTACAHALLGVGLLASVSCGRNTGLSLRILTPPGEADPFSTATTIAIAIAGPDFAAQESLAPVSGGRFEVKLELTSPARDKWVTVIVEARDGAGMVLGRGRSPALLLPRDNTEISVYVGRPGRVTQSPVTLPDESGTAGTALGRRGMAATSLRGRRGSGEPGLGALLVGGQDDSGQLPTRAWRYSPVLHQLIDSGKPVLTRHGAVLLASADADVGHQALLFGGSDPSGTLPTAAERYDPQVSDATSLWQAATGEDGDAGPPGAYFPAAAELRESVYLVAGGSSQSTGGQPLANAVLITRKALPSMLGRPVVTRLPSGGTGGPMQAARSEHSISPIAVEGGVGALLFGGLSLVDRMAQKPVAEIFAEGAGKNTFTALTFPVEPSSRRGHSAVTLANGHVVILGGYSEDAAGQKTVFSSALLVDVAAKTAQLRDGLLSTPRHAASLTLLPNELLLCGGFGTDGTPLASCEAFSPDDKLTPLGPPIPLPRPRAGHLAIKLETEQVLLIGGTGEGMRTVAPIDLYTPR
jgi:hypothetical protein